MIPFGDDQGRLRFAVTTAALVAGLVGVYAWQWTLSPEDLAGYTSRLGVRVDEVLRQFEAGGDRRTKTVHDFFTVGVLPLLSYPFVHSGPIHVASCALGLWVFGSRLESRTSSWRLLLFFVASTLAGGVAQLIFGAGRDVVHLGASAPVGALAITYLLLYPKARVRLLLLPLPVFARLPAAGAVLVFAVLQFHKIQDFAGFGCGVSVDYVPLVVAVGVCGIVLGPLVLGWRSGGKSSARR